MTFTVPLLILSLSILNEAAYPSFLEEITSLRKRAGSSAPSYAKCNIDDDEREDCGFYGVTSHQCQSRGCCWRSSNRQGAPWCYHSSRNLHLKCVSVAESRRQECGFPGISASQCVKQDCCWRPTQRARTPWCYTSSDPTGSSESCGSPAIRPSVSSRIIGGKDAVAHSWPWQVSIQDAEEGHKCGGSLISQQWVITAAHCRDLFRDEDTTIELGLHRSEIPDEQTVSRGIAGVYIHPEYKKGGRQILNDLLLIKLSKPISYTKAISPLCLPPHGQDVQPGSTCYATGWGNINNRGEKADELQQLAVPVLDRATCNQPDWYDGYVTSDMICAGYQQGDKDACKGDSGGPLECRGNGGSWVLAGVTSWGWGCAKQNHPGVYAKVSNYIDWIASTMRKHS